MLSTCSEISSFLNDYVALCKEDKLYHLKIGFSLQFIEYFIIVVSDTVNFGVFCFLNMSLSKLL